MTRRTVGLGLLVGGTMRALRYVQENFKGPVEPRGATVDLGEVRGEAQELLDGSRADELSPHSDR